VASTRKGHGRVAKVMFGGGDAVLGRGGAGAATSDWTGRIGGTAVATLTGLSEFHRAQWHGELPCAWIKPYIILSHHVCLPVYPCRGGHVRDQVERQPHMGMDPF